MQWSRRLVAGLSTQGPGFYTTLVHVRFFVGQIGKKIYFHFFVFRKLNCLRTCRADYTRPFGMPLHSSLSFVAENFRGICPSLIHFINAVLCWMCMRHDFIMNKATAKVFGKHFGLVYLLCAWLVSKSQYVSRQSLKSTRVFLVIVCLQANAGTNPDFQPRHRTSLVQPSRF